MKQQLLTLIKIAAVGYRRPRKSQVPDFDAKPYANQTKQYFETRFCDPAAAGVADPNNYS